jgi:hypothetical protein
MNEPVLYRIGAHWLAIAIFLLIIATNWLGFQYRKFSMNCSNNSQELTSTYNSCDVNQGILNLTNILLIK